MTRRGARRWAVGTRVEFGRGSRVVLARLRLLQTPWGGVYTHRILAPDDQGSLHDHPWPFVTLVLSGCYTELRRSHPGARVEVRTWRRGSVHVMRGRTAHRIIHVEPGTRTLLLTGRPLAREWGFYTPRGRVLWSDYPGRWQVLRGGRGV